MTKISAMPLQDRRVVDQTSGTAPAIGMSSRWIALLGLSLAALTCWLYWPVRSHGFLAFDDGEYVTENAMVQAGLTWAGVKWAFTTGYFSYWHPLTWLSHMLDVELFGRSPAGPHVVNAVIHAINGVLLFALLRRLTGAVWRSVLVAALFALHPLHVESVAWVAERKDVLSGFFFLLTLGAYANYARRTKEKDQRPRTRDQRPESSSAASGSLVSGPWSLVFTRWYGAALVLFACGLMSKPMVVTLPCVLLLLDLWPLRRWQIGPGRETVSALARLAAEKIPFFALTAVGCVVTFLAQRQNDVVQSLEEFSLGGRITNAVVAYARYLGKTCWPTDLAFFYPHPGMWPPWIVAAAALLLLALTLAVIGPLRRHPYAAAGWFWFVGMLVPTIGVIQVGGQSLADRYTYLPHIGLFIAVIWGAGEAWALWRRPTAWLAVAAGVAVAAFALRARDQLRHWRDSESLFRHALAVTENNFLAHNNLGNVLAASGKLDEAVAHYEQALAIRPDDDHAANNLGSVLLRKGQAEQAIPYLQQTLERHPQLTLARHALCNAMFRAGRAREAVPHLEQILSVEPRNPQVHGDLGVALLEAGNPAAALRALERARELGSDDAAIRGSLGRSLLRLGQPSEARAHLEAALKTSPGLSDVHYDLGLALFQEGELPAAILHFETAARLQPGNAEIQSNLGWALLVSDRVDDAIARFQTAVKIDPAAAVARTNLAGAWLRKGNAREAIGCFDLLLRDQPDHVPGLTGLAWLLATWPVAEVRNGPRALELAGRANQISGGRDAAVLRVLGAAYAETGRFAEAVATGERALQMAENHPDTTLRAALHAELGAYQSGAAFRDPITLAASGDGNRL